ncbi:mesh-like CUB and sushi domain-containing protein [Leptotrombidium deliense]|uniref:Mesh-like CUB and sushi domain-containing protein n=1 Tax=Leptotrombidium deliense TaxID=299467 RepID=A0A443SS51_9ACAR|nr:mesh-like CUB and sushi domain-containing protein [Leptotrombidium deliense]
MAAPPNQFSSIEPEETAEVMKMRQELMYPYNGTDFMEISSSRPIHDQPLPFLLRFFGFEFQYAYIHRDGYIGFNKGLLSYNFPLKFPLIPTDPLVEEDPSLIAPFFALQDIPSSREVPFSGVYFKIVNIETEPNITLRDRLILDFREGMIGASNFRPKHAMIITWRNMTFASRRDEKGLKTNTYQAVIATDEMRTYAMFNYEKIEWITHADNYEGLKGPAAFIGFNAGNITRAFEYRPYSQQPRISLISAKGYGNGLPGRYFFQIDEEIWPGACIEKDLDPNLPDRLPLTFFPRYGHMLGGTLVNVTGPCLRPNDIITCTFENWKVKGLYRSPNHATCISPPVMYHGYIDLTITVNERTLFLGRFYLQPPDIATPDVFIHDGNETLEDPPKLTLKWSYEKLFWDPQKTVDISLYGYRESNDIYPQLTFIRTLVSGVQLGVISYELDVQQLRENEDPDMRDILFGYLAVTLTNPTLMGKDMKKSPILWSRSMPLAWYFKRQWERQYGRNGAWKKEFCRRWYYMEEDSDRFATTVTRCPCTVFQALQDMGRFLPDTSCNLVSKNCETFHKGAQRCFKTGRPSTGGSGQTCCYDEHGELIQTADTMYGGRPSRSFEYGKHPYKMRMMIPALSNWLHDTMPFFFCCKWQQEQDNSETCQMYKYWRTSQDCSSYQIPAVGVVFGDPHFITFDGTNYTFNGHGEFVLVRTDDPVHKLDIQARFEQVPRAHFLRDEIRATHLTAIAAKDNQSAIVEFRIRPKAARWRYHMYVIVDKEYVFFWDESLRVQNFRGVTLYQPEGIQNMSQIIAMFDSGAGMEVLTTDGHMTAHIYLPQTFQEKTDGLLGYYSKLKEDDFRTPETKQRRRRVMKPQSLSMDQIHRDFAMEWRVQEGVFADGVGSSLFWHDSKTFAQYDNKSFVPEFRLPPDDLRFPENSESFEREMEITCGESVACRYDYMLTLDKSFASVTKMHEAWGYGLQSFRRDPTIRCPALSAPVNGRKSDNRYSPGTIVTFACDPGYRLVGYESRFCRNDGLWSWGIDPQCISELFLFH